MFWIFDLLTFKDLLIIQCRLFHNSGSMNCQRPILISSSLAWFYWLVLGSFRSFQRERWNSQRLWWDSKLLNLCALKLSSSRRANQGFFPKDWELRLDHPSSLRQTAQKKWTDCWENPLRSRGVKWISQLSLRLRLFQEKHQPTRGSILCS